VVPPVVPFLLILLIVFPFALTTGLAPELKMGYMVLVPVPEVIKLVLVIVFPLILVAVTVDAVETIL
jgi:hypothetical protein